MKGEDRGFLETHTFSPPACSAIYSEGERVKVKKQLEEKKG